VKKIAGATIDRTRAGCEKKIPHHCAEYKWFDMIGSDGRGALTGCIVWTPKEKIYHVVLAQILPQGRAA
jgi:hypothetical protein